MKRRKGERTIVKQIMKDRKVSGQKAARIASRMYWQSREMQNVVSQGKHTKRGRGRCSNFCHKGIESKSIRTVVKFGRTFIYKYKFNLPCGKRHRIRQDATGKGKIKGVTC